MYPTKNFPPIVSIIKNDECYCIDCEKMRKMKEVEYIAPEFAEVQTTEYKIHLSCGHRLSIKLSNIFED